MEGITKVLPGDVHDEGLKLCQLMSTEDLVHLCPPSTFNISFDVMFQRCVEQTQMIPQIQRWQKSFSSYSTSGIKDEMKWRVM
jgi:hypothetical protein